MAVVPIQYLIHPQGLPIRVMQWGTSGPPLLLIHGLGSHCEAWRGTAERLAALGLRCIAIDTPGHGLSYKGDGFDHTAAGHAALLEAVADALGEPTLDVACSSLGGLHGAAFAVRTPRRVRSLTLIGSVGLVAMTPERRKWTADYLHDMSRDAVRARLHRGVFAPTVFTEDYIEETWRMNNSAGAAASFGAISRYYAGSINDDVQLDGLARLGADLPVLLLWGRDDPTVTYDVGEQALARIPGATLIGIADTKHMPQIERPRLSARVIAQHLAKRLALSLERLEPPAADDPSYETREHRS
ncbi:MAG: alpha/beta fold hydrolase [Alphaproteobacteria bacterium]|nr:alpha/beta fold hydrolase [Alphaproteobacteria bacterium]